MKLECPDCKSQVTAKGNGAVRCPNCGFTAKAPANRPVRPTQKPAASQAPTAKPAQPSAPGQNQAGTQTPATNGFSIAALITGILGFCMFFPAAIAAVVLGIIGMNQCRETGQPGEQMAVAGLILGSIGVAFWVIMFTGNFWFFR